MTFSVRLEMQGPQAPETALFLARRLEELGHPSVCEGPAVVFQATAEAEETLSFEAGPHDPPEFAAEKVLDALEERGWIQLDALGLGHAEEAEIEARLRGLGYVE